MDGLMRKLLLLALCLVLTAGVASAGGMKTLTLGDSQYSVNVPESFVNGEVTDEDKAEGQVAYYKSDETTLDFDVYQLSGNGTLEEFAATDAKAFGNTEAVTSREINGVKVSSYRSSQESEGETYDTIAYVFGGEGKYIRLVFWLDGNNAEAEAEAIITSLKK